MRTTTRTALKATAATLVAAVVAFFIFILSGAYDISATDQHTKLVYWLIELTMQRSVAVRARESDTPDLSRAELIDKGLVHYQRRCLPCHGGPGRAPDDAALGMTPAPANLIPTTRQWTADKIYWVVKNGIKMTGMPAWKYRMTDAEIWEVVSFVKERLPTLSPRDFEALIANLPADAGGDNAARATDVHVSQGNAEAGRRAIDQYACATCHVIPGITGASRQVGPPLTGIASRTYIAGVLQNTRENMVLWITQPQHVRPMAAMPDVRARESDARDIAAYLETLRSN